MHGLNVTHNGVKAFMMSHTIILMISDLTGYYFSKTLICLMKFSLNSNWNTILHEIWPHCIFQPLYFLKIDFLFSYFGNLENLEENASLENVTGNN